MNLLKKGLAVGIVFILCTVAFASLINEKDRTDIGSKENSDYPIGLEEPMDDPFNEKLVPRTTNFHDGESAGALENIQFASSSSKQIKTIVLAADNSIDQAQNQGLITFFSSPDSNRYSCKAYSIVSMTLTQRGWAVFDLDDIGRWSGVNVIDAGLVVRSSDVTNIKTINFSAINTTPYENAPSDVAGSIYNSTALASNFIGNFTTNEYQNTSYHDINVAFNSRAVERINERLGSASEHHLFNIGMFVSEVLMDTGYAHTNWFDPRLVVTFECDGDIETDPSEGGIALGDTLTGITLFSGGAEKHIPYGRMIIDNERRSYSVWNISIIKDLFDDNNISKVQFTNVGLSLNLWSASTSELTNISVFQLSENVFTANASAIHQDIVDGDLYYNLVNDTVDRFKEYNWTLSNDALNDLQDAYDSIDPIPFGTGIFGDSDGITYGFSPKLVLEWEFNETADDLPPVADANGPYDGEVGTPVQLDGSGSYDPNNDMLEYQWDLDDDGVWDTNFSSEPKMDHTWLSEYFGRIRLRVTDGTNFDIDYANVSIRKKPQAGNDTEIDIDPDTLNPKSNGKWITCYIEVPSGYNVTDINRSSILLNGNLSAESKWFSVGDHDGDGIADVMVKFDRQAVIDMVEPGDSVEMTVTFKINGVDFSGTDHIRVLDKEKKDR